MRPFKRKHKHHFEHGRFIYNGATVGAKISECKCGEVRSELTDAGCQQVGWWIQLGKGLDEAQALVFAGEYPWEIFDRGD